MQILFLLLKCQPPGLCIFPTSGFAFTLTLFEPLMCRLIRFLGFYFAIFYIYTHIIYIIYIYIYIYLWVGFVQFSV